MYQTRLTINIIFRGLLPLVFLTQTANAADISKIDIIVSTCFTCHGVNGIGSGKIPELRGLKKSDITESLLGFASGDEKSTIMGRHAKAYSKDEINLLAEYFSSLKKK
jgi:sulfide dehydrogenase cytochrome subunit